MAKYIPEKTYEVLRFAEQIALVRCFVYPHVVRCGAVFLGAGMPGKMPLMDSDGKWVTRIFIPELFKKKAEAVTMGDGGESGPTARPRMLEFDIQARWDDDLGWVELD